MPSYNESLNGYRIDESDGSIAGTRVFVRDDTNGTIDSADLPAVDIDFMVDADGYDIPRCKCRRRVTTLDQAGHPLITCTYSTKPNAFETGASVSTDPTSRSYTLGSEVQPVGGYAWYWKTTGDVINQTIYRKVPTGTFTRSVTVPEAQIATFRATADALANKTNSAAWESYNAGEVMFNGYTGGTTTNSDGDLEYRFDCHFTYRLLRAWSVTSDSHNYLWNQDTLAWDRPNSASNGLGDYLYETDADFETLFT